MRIKSMAGERHVGVTAPLAEGQREDCVEHEQHTDDNRRGRRHETDEPHTLEYRCERGGAPEGDEAPFVQRPLLLLLAKERVADEREAEEGVADPDELVPDRRPA